MILNDREKKRLKQLFNKIDTHNITNESTNRILLVDSLNTFIRSFMAIPTLNENGLHVGGISGFLKSIGYAIRILKPTRVVCVFDGHGGSLRRRKIYPKYKSGKRSRVKFNRAYQGMTSSDDENKNLEIEFSRILQYLKILPVTIVSVDYIEADDTIAYLATEYFNSNSINYIMSTDKDFLQLVNDDISIPVIKVWSPTKKQLYGCQDIINEYNISCENFIFYRALSGDKSDNIPGIRGAGLKTIIKSFPFLQDNKKSSINEIITHSYNNIGKYKIYENVIESQDVLKRNYDLMQLHTSIIRPFTQLSINKIMEGNILPLSPYKFYKLISEDSMVSVFPNYREWLMETWSTINSLVD